MSVDPQQQLQMLGAAALCGLFLGVLYDLLAALRIFTGAYLPPPRMLRYYQRPLPLMGRPAMQGGPHLMRRYWRAAVITVGDLFYCLGAAFLAEVILFRFNRGAFRVAVPLLMLLMLALWRMTAAKLSAFLTDGLAFLLLVTWRYLCFFLALPWVFAGRLCRRFLLDPSVARCRRRRAVRLQNRSDLLCQAQLEDVREGILTRKPRAKRKQKIE